MTGTQNAPDLEWGRTLVRRSGCWGQRMVLKKGVGCKLARQRVTKKGRVGAVADPVQKEHYEDDKVTPWVAR